MGFTADAVADLARAGYYVNGAGPRVWEEVHREALHGFLALAEKKKEQNVAINGNQMKPGGLVYAARYNEYGGQEGQWNINHLSDDLEEAMRLWRTTYKPWLEKDGRRVAELVQIEVTVLQRGGNDN